MSWDLHFYPSDPEETVTLEELDALFERLPRFRRVPSAGKEAAPGAPVSYRYANPISGASLLVEARPAPEGEPGGAPGLPPQLRMRLPLPPSPVCAQEGVPLAVEICQHLGFSLGPAGEPPRGPTAAAVPPLIAAYLQAPGGRAAGPATETAPRRGCLAGLLWLPLLARGGAGWDANPLDAERVGSPLPGAVEEPDPHPGGRPA